MANLDLSQLTLNVENAQTMAEVVIENALLVPEITDIHEVHTGIVANKFIPIFGGFGLIGKAGSACNVANSTEEISVSQKQWTPADMVVRLAHCKTTSPELFKAFRRNVKMYESYNLEGSEELLFLATRLVEAVKVANFRSVWFGDTAAATVANGGVLTNGTDITYFTMINGLWKQAFAAVAGGTTDRYTIAANATATKALQDTLSTTFAYDILNGLYNLATPESLAAEGTEFLVTGSIYKNWVAYTEDKSTSFTLDRLEGGVTQAMFRGIPVKPMYQWDTIIRTYMDNAVTWDRPHRALLTSKSNIPVGTSDEESLKEVISFYDQNTHTNKADAIWNIDAKILVDNQIVVAY